MFGHFLGLWASFTSQVFQDSLVHQEFHGPDAPSLVQAILHWTPLPQNSQCKHTTMPDVFCVTCIFPVWQQDSLVCRELRCSDALSLAQAYTRCSQTLGTLTPLRQTYLS